MNYKGGVNTKCPFYITESDKSIRCEGLYDNTNISTKFESIGEKGEYQEEFCFHYPNSCKLCKELEKKTE